MHINLKALGAALLAVFAIGAAGTASASAETLDHFTSSSPNEKTILTGEAVGTESENLFGIKAVASLAIHCENSKVKGGATVVGKSVTEATVHATLGGCTSNLGTATVNTTGCDLILKGTTDKFTNTSGVEEGKKGTGSIECTAGSAVTLSTGGCTISYGAESGGKPVNQNMLGATATNEGSGSTRDIKAAIVLDKIHYTTNEAFACKLAGIPGTGTDGFLTGTLTIKGYQDNEVGGPSPHQDSFPNEGSQVAIEAS